jgi:NAD(P)H-hydrate epimerase
MTVSEMGEADRRTVAAGISGPQLMHAAGGAVVREIVQRWSTRRVTVLCGPGNNGGDGFVVAAELAAAGWPVRVALVGSRERMRGDAKYHAERWSGPVEPLTETSIADAQLVIDAVFGSGLNRALDPEVKHTLEAVSKRGVPVLAIDVPSGVAGDTGESFGAINADCTVTFTRKKPGHVLLPGRELCGEVVVADIGTPQTVLDGIEVHTWENDPALWLHEWPRLTNVGNKYSRGHALVSGGYPTTGAARMAAQAAARAGAGLTSIAVPEIGLPVYAAALTSIMVTPISRPEDFSRLLADKRYTALLIGPGAGVDATTRARALAMLATHRSVVLDADAISVFAGRLDVLREAIRGPCVMTPHAGEFARLFDTTGDKLTRARTAARSAGAVIVLKGADTVIAAPDGRAIINANAPPTLATAGSGDVLSGIVLGLLAQGMDAFQAASAAVWLHGAAAAHFGPGLIAEDLPDALPAVFRQLKI